MSQTAITIANRALVNRLGVKRITAFGENTQSGRVMTQETFEAIRDQELEVNAWRFAATRVQLPASASPPVYGYDYAYTLPSGHLRPLYIHNDEAEYDLIGYTIRASTYGPVSPINRAAFQIVGQTIETDIEPPLDFEYIQVVDNVGLWTSLFRNLVTCALALEVCEALTDSATKFRQMQVQYDDAIRKARQVNAFWRPPRRAHEGLFMRARHYGG